MKPKVDNPQNPNKLASPGFPVLGVCIFHTQFFPILHLVHLQKIAFFLPAVLGLIGIVVANLAEPDKQITFYHLYVGKIYIQTLQNKIKSNITKFHQPNNKNLKTKIAKIFKHSQTLLNIKKTAQNIQQKY